MGDRLGIGHAVGGVAGAIFALGGSAAAATACVRRLRGAAATLAFRLRPAAQCRGPQGLEPCPPDQKNGVGVVLTYPEVFLASPPLGVGPL